jgi:hypothetical protein
MKLTTLVANTQLDALAAQLNGGGLRLFEGKNLLAEVKFGADAFHKSNNRQAVAKETLSDPDARATGKADNYQLVTASGDVVGEGTVGENGTKADVNLKNVHIVKHAEVVVDSFILEA